MISRTCNGKGIGWLGWKYKSYIYNKNQRCAEHLTYSNSFNYHNNSLQ